MVAQSPDSVSGRPFRPEVAYRVRLLPAVAAGLAAGLALLLLYYATLGALPAVFAYPLPRLLTVTFPPPAWASRFDVAQFLGTILFPPYPSPQTWWVGLGLWIGMLAGGGVLYAILLAWTFQRSDIGKGIGFAVLLFGGLALLMTLAQGFHPAIMRNALPDPGVFLLGWTPWAPVQLLAVFAVYGAVLGALYRRGTAGP